MDFSVLVIAHRRTVHLRRILDGIQASSWWPQEVVVVYLDGPRPVPVSCQVPQQVYYLQSGPNDRGLPLARARKTAAHRASNRRIQQLMILLALVLIWKSVHHEGLSQYRADSDLCTGR